MRFLISLLALFALDAHAQDPADTGRDISFSRVREQKVFFSQEDYYYRNINSKVKYSEYWYGVKTGGLQGSFTEDFEKQRLQLNTTVARVLDLDFDFLDMIHLEGKVETDRPPYYLVGAELPMDKSVNLFAAAVRNTAAESIHMVFGPVIYYGDSIITVFLYPSNYEKLDGVTSQGAFVSRFRLRDRESPLWLNVEFTGKKYEIEDDGFYVDYGFGLDLGFQRVSIGYQQDPNWEGTLWSRATFKASYFYLM